MLCKAVNLRFSVLLVVDLFEQVLNIALNPIVVHVREDRLDRFCFGELIELMAAVGTSELEKQSESDIRIVLHDVLEVGDLL